LAAAGEGAEARRRLADALAGAAAAGFVDYGFELELTRNEIAMASGEAGAGEGLADLERRAAATGFALVARRARAARGGA
jgi:hypothetical protein